MATADAIDALMQQPLQALRTTAADLTDRLELVHDIIRRRERQLDSLQRRNSVVKNLRREQEPAKV